MKELIEKYEIKLELMEMFIKEYDEEKNSIHGFINSERESEYKVLCTKISLLKNFIEDLKKKRKKAIIKRGGTMDFVNGCPVIVQDNHENITDNIILILQSLEIEVEVDKI